ncbi:MAG: TetR/AcrR family transcriptional regulator [Cyclobacteriaceae bacterium]
MAKKKTETKIDIIGAYMNNMLEHGHRPKSIYSFCKGLGIKESNFYEQFGSFDIVEKNIYKTFFDNTVNVLAKNNEYATYNPQNRLLSFYYTFFEVLKSNRSYVLLSLKEERNKLKALSTLSLLRKVFQEYVEDLEIDTLNLREERLEKVKELGMKEWTWAQLLFTLKFWIEDDSAGFEKTDILIEKSINTSFALLDNSTLNSVFDLGKFLFKEKMMA